MTSDVPKAGIGLEQFLKCMQFEDERVYMLSREFSSKFTFLAAESMDQFLPTPVTESIILSLSKHETQGRFVHHIHPSRSSDTRNLILSYDLEV